MKVAILTTLLLVLAVCLTLGISYSVNNPPNISTSIQASPPEMPLLKSWITILEHREVPVIGGRVQAITPQIINGFDWKQASINLLEAKLYNNRSDAVAMISSSVEGTSTQSIVQLLYWDKQGLHRRKLNSERDGWIYLMENRTLAIAVSRQSPKTASYEEDMQLVGKVVVLSPQADNIDITTQLATGTNMSSQQRYLQLYHERDKKLLLHDLLSGQPIAEIPKPPPDWSDTSSRELEQRQVGDKLVVGGMEYIPKMGNSFIWSLLPKGSQTWETTHQHINSAYPKAFLPKPLHAMSLRLEDLPVRPKIWKDGSIIFRLVCEQHQAGDFLRFVGLVRQPRQGTPQLLTWAMYHSFEPNVNSSDDSYAEQNKKASSRTFQQVWFPAEGGQIKSEFQRTEWTNDFFFDVDAANDSIIYLLGGQLWAVDIAANK